MINYRNKDFFERRGLILANHKYQLLTDSVREQIANGSLAMDAQPGLFTAPSAGVLSMFTTYVDPKVIDVLFAPMKGALVAGSEVKKGNATDTSIVFNQVESTGVVAAYGDYSNNGVANANANYPQRQPFHYQLFTNWGALEVERMSLQKIDWIAMKDKSSILVLNKFQNKSYFFGVEDLQNYGLLNDPSLPASIAPSGTSPNIVWSAKTADQIYNDFVALFTNLAQRSDGYIDHSTKLTMGMSPYAYAQLTKSNNLFNNTALTMIERQFNIEVITAPEFATEAGEVVRLKCDEINGNLVEEVSFTEKLRSFPIFQKHSAYEQKKMQGTNGALIYYPLFVSTMLGV